MSDSEAGTASPSTVLRCAECETNLAEGQDHERTEGGVFCRPCFQRLTGELQAAIATQGQDINWVMAAAGGVAGAAVGVLIWWGFTVVSGIAFGLVAIVIGYAVGKGVVLLSGPKRHVGLQALSAAVAVAAFAYASYLVSRTFIEQAMAAEGQDVVLPLLPDPALFVQVASAGFGAMDLVFLAIVVWQAWTMPGPVRLTG